MKKLITTCFAALSLISIGCNASQVINTASSQGEPSYACKVMKERGSNMFCKEDRVQKSSLKLTGATVASLSGSSFSCNTMKQRGSEMFCQ